MSQMPIVDQQIYLTARKFEMKDDQKQKYKEFVETVAKEFKVVVAGAFEVVIFGSYATNLSTIYSDVDVAIVPGKWYSPRVLPEDQLLVRVRDRIKQQKLGIKATLIEAALVCLLKLQKDDMCIDLSIQSNAEILRQRNDLSIQYTNEFPQFRDLYIVMHGYMKECGKGDNSKQGIGGFALQQMLYVSFQQSQNKYENQQSASLSQCLYDFVHLYAEKFDVKKQAVHAQKRKIVPLTEIYKPEQTNRQKNRADSDQLIVLDPLSNMKNLTPLCRWLNVREHFVVILYRMKQRSKQKLNGIHQQQN